MSAFRTVFASVREARACLPLALAVLLLAVAPAVPAGTGVLPSGNQVQLTILQPADGQRFGLPEGETTVTLDVQGMATAACANPPNPACPTLLLRALWVAVDGGAPVPLDNAYVAPPLPTPANAAFQFPLALGEGTHQVCITAQAVDASGQAFATECVGVTVLRGCPCKLSRIIPYFIDVAGDKHLIGVTVEGTLDPADPDLKTVDITVTVEWRLLSLCDKAEGMLCTAQYFLQKESSDWVVDKKPIAPKDHAKFVTETVEGDPTDPTGAGLGLPNVICTNDCDQVARFTRVKTIYKAKLKKPAGGAIVGGTTGTVKLTLVKGFACEDEEGWTIVLRIDAPFAAKGSHDAKLSDYDGDKVPNAGDKAPFDSSVPIPPKPPKPPKKP